MTTFKIDARIRGLIPELAPEERHELEANLRAFGCRDPLVVWNGILIDGHNRYEICQRHSIAFNVVVVDLPDRAAAEDWIDRNQLGRRNLTADAFKLLLGRVYNRVKKAANDGGKGTPKGTVGQTDPQLRTSETLAAEYGVSEKTIRRAGSFATEVAKDKTLADAVRKRQPVKDVKRKAKAKKREKQRDDNRQQIAAIPAITKAVASKFSTIMVDPPWDWGDEGDHDQMGRAQADFAQMSIEELLEFPLGQFADANAHLYCWITNRSLPKGFALLDKWGFRYITALTWPKPSFGMGNYFRGQTEHILFGVRGSLPLNRKDASTLLPQWPRGPGGHSSKPVEIYPYIETCSPGPYLEVFSRMAEPRPDWRTYGELTKLEAAE
jgi:N6-adenosine-specific RNA methylase IME4